MNILNLWLYTHSSIQTPIPLVRSGRFYEFIAQEHFASLSLGGLNPKIILDEPAFRRLLIAKNHSRPPASYPKPKTRCVLVCFRWVKSKKMRGGWDVHPKINVNYTHKAQNQITHNYSVNLCISLK